MKTKRIIWAAFLAAAVIAGLSSCEDEPLNSDAFYASMDNNSVNSGKGVTSGEPMAVTLDVNQEFCVISYSIPVLDASTIDDIIKVDRSAYDDKGKTGSSHVTYTPQKGNKYTFSFDGSLVYVDTYRYEDGEAVPIEMEIQSMVTGKKKKVSANFVVYHGNELSVSIKNQHTVQTTAALRQIDGKPVPLLFSGDSFVLTVKGAPDARFRFINSTTGVSELDAADAGNLIHSSSAEYTLDKKGEREITVGDYVTNDLCFGEDGCRRAKLTIENVTTNKKYDFELPFYTAPEFKPAVSVVDGMVKGGQPIMLKLEYPFKVDTVTTGTNPVISISSMKILGWNQKRFNETESDNNDIDLSRLFPDGFTWYYPGGNQESNEDLKSILVGQTQEPITIKSRGNAIVTKENNDFTLQVTVEDKVYTGLSQTVTCQFDSKYPAAQTNFHVTSLASNFENVPYYAPEINSEGRTELENITVSSASRNVVLRIEGETGGGSDKYGYVWKPKNPEIAINGVKAESANNLKKDVNIEVNTKEAYEKGVYYLTIYSCDPQGKPYLTATGEYAGFKTIAVKVIPTIDLYAEAIIGYKWFDGTNTIHFDMNAYSYASEQGDKRYKEKELNENIIKSEWAGWPQDIYVVAKYKSSDTDYYSNEIPLDITIKVKMNRALNAMKCYSYYGAQKELFGNSKKTVQNRINVYDYFDDTTPGDVPPEETNEEIIITKTYNNASLNGSYVLRTLQDWDSNATLIWCSGKWGGFVYRMWSNHSNATEFELEFSKNVTYNQKEVYVKSFVDNIQNKGWFNFHLSSEF